MLAFNFKGLFIRSDTVSNPVPITIKFYNCANGNGPSDGQNGSGTHFARQTDHHYYLMQYKLNGDRDGIGDGVGKCKHTLI